LLSRLAVAVLSCALVVGSITTSAGAATGGSLTITPPQDTVLYGDCYEYPYSYAVTPPSADWNLEITLEDPFGAIETRDYVMDSDPLAGQESFLLCGEGIDDPGTYTIRAVLAWYDSQYNKTVEPPLITSFTLAKPATRTSLTVSTKRPVYSSKVVFKTGSTEQGRLGYSRLSFVKVRLEKYAGGKWRKVDVATSDGDGVTKFRYRWNSRRPAVKVRAVTLGTVDYTSSTSRPVTIRVR
jgi:hypothetical protein